MCATPPPRILSTILSSPEPAQREVGTCETRKALLIVPQFQSSGLRNPGRWDLRGGGIFFPPYLMLLAPPSGAALLALRRRDRPAGSPLLMVVVGGGGETKTKREGEEERV